MKKKVGKELENQEDKFNNGAIGLEQKMNESKKVTWIVYGVVIVALAALFGILLGTGTI